MNIEVFTALNVSRNSVLCFVFRFVLSVIGIRESSNVFFFVKLLGKYIYYFFYLHSVSRIGNSVGAHVVLSGNLGTKCYDTAVLHFPLHIKMKILNISFTPVGIEPTTIALVPLTPGHI